MKKWKGPLLALLAAATLAGAALADDLYVKNKLFEGPTGGAGSSMTAHAETLLKAFAITDFRIDGNSLVIGEKTLVLEDGPDGPMVSVKNFVDAVGGKMVVSSELGTVDLFHNPEAPVEVATRQLSKELPAAVKKPPVIKATQESPGAVVDLAADAVPGKENIALFYADW